MSSLLTINYHINNANNFIADINVANNNHYVFAARHYPWLNANNQNDDTAVLTVNTSVSAVELDIYNELLFGKLIQGSDISHVIPRYNWTSNTVYAQYDQTDTELYTKDFFVVTTAVNDSYNVYKCLFNNKNAVSIIKPSLQNTRGTFETGDGYIWKYMYTLDSTANTKFTTTNFIAVFANNAVQGNAIPGTIDIIKLANGGVGYDVYYTGGIQSIIDGSNIKLAEDSSTLNNYYANSSIYLKSGFGAGQVREISAYNGSSKVATIAVPIDIFTRFDFTNATFISGGGSVGEKMEQIIDTTTFLYKVGYISTNANVVQSDTGVAGKVFTSNSSALTISRFNKSTAFSNTYPIRETSDTGTATTSIKGNVSNSSVLALSVITYAGTGYSANANVTIVSTSGSGAVAEATANASGKITALVISNTGNAYATTPTVTIANPIAQSFNANTAVTAGTGEGSNNIIALTTANLFSIGDMVIYSVNAGNTILTGLTSNTTYFIQHSNVTVIALSATSNTSAGNRIALTKGLSQTGHFIQGKPATATIHPSSYVVINATANAFTGSYANNQFIRFGENANTNIRRIMSVNATTIIVNTPFSNSINSANTFDMTIVVEPDVISTTFANGIISNTNLDALKLSFTNSSIVGASFIIGERVDLVDSSNTLLGANGSVAYSNSSIVFISGVGGSNTWVNNQKLKGASSLIVANIASVDNNPNVTIKNPNGTFIASRTVDFSSTSTSNTGFAKINDIVNLSQDVIEYEIGPTIKIVGDGSNALAVATVNTTIGSSNTISKITVINPGLNYTEASISIYANSTYGSSAVATPVISPLLGHGFNPVYELGSRYAGIDVKFDTTSNESWYYPSDITIRKLGILKNPKFANINITVTNFDRIHLTTNSVSGWSNGEIVLQSTTNAAGIVTTSNSSTVELENVKGTFITSATNTIYGYTSGLTATVANNQILRFFANDSISQLDGSSAKISTAISNSELYLTEVQGLISNGSVIYNTTNSYATINSISNFDKSRNLSTNFGLRFNQTSRLTMLTKTGSYTNNEFVTQTVTGAKGRVLSGTTDMDLLITSVTGAFTIGDTIYNSSNSANAKIFYANSTYLKLTSVSNTSAFPSANLINNGLSTNATISNAYSVLLVGDITKISNFIIGNNTQTVVGNTSGANGVLLAVTPPDLIRETGKVMYLETSNTVISRGINSTEEIRLVIKF